MKLIIPNEKNTYTTLHAYMHTGQDNHKRVFELIITSLSSHFEFKPIFSTKKKKKDILLKSTL